MGRVETKTVKNPGGGTFNTITYEYDLMGRLYRTIDKSGTTKNTYDKAGRLIRVQYPENKTVSYEYDACGNRTRLTYPDTTYITYEYDELNRLTCVKNQAGTALATYTYDERSRRTGLDYLNGAYADYSYDAAGRLLVLDNQTNNGQHKYAYTYDYVGNRLEMTVTNAGGVGIHLYSYDNIYQITEVNYPDSLGYLATDTEFHYDAAGNRTSVIDGGGTCTYTTNNLNQYTAAGPTNFSYDSSGNMTHDANYGYSYDPENRLIQVTKSGGPTDLAAALDSFLTYTTGGAASWTPVGGAYAQSGYINHNQESWMQAQVEGPGTLTFQWKVSSEAGCDQLQFYLDDELQDAIDGEQDWDEISYQVTGSGTHTFRWRYQKDYSLSEGDDAGYVDQVQWTGPLPEDPPTDRWHHLTYVYDASGRRIEKQYDYDTVLKYVYDGDHCIAEYDAGGNLRRKYIYGPGVDQPICMIEATQTYAGTYYYHFDALGSVVALTSGKVGSMGNTVQVYEYDVYGRVGMLDANHPNRIMFTGREFDKETGLYYCRARYYNPQIGRFLQTDRVGYGAGMNLYAYCVNNPLNLTDPSGLEYVFKNDPNFWQKRQELREERKQLEDEIKTLKKQLGELEGQLARLENALEWWEAELQDSIYGYCAWWSWLQTWQGLGALSTVPPDVVLTPYPIVNEVLSKISLVATGAAQMMIEKAEEHLAEQDAAIVTAIDRITELTEKRNAVLREYSEKLGELQEKQKRLQEVKEQLALMWYEDTFNRTKE